MSQKSRPGGDPARSLALLWSAHGKPGRSGLTIRAIVIAAIELADRDGLAAVSMRNVAARLNAGAMSLYTHVPGRAELTDLMIDTVYGQLYDDVDAPLRQPGGWRGGLAFIAARNWDLYQRHPWLHQIVSARPLLGPNEALKYEAELRPLDNLGLSDVEMDAALTLILTHVAGTARRQANLTQVEHDTGLDDAEWWVQSEPLLTTLMDRARFPVAERVGKAAGQEFQASANPEHALGFGLSRILDGIAALIASRNGNAGASGPSVAD